MMRDLLFLPLMSLFVSLSANVQILDTENDPSASDYVSSNASNNNTAAGPVGYQQAV